MFRQTESALKNEYICTLRSQRTVKDNGFRLADRSKSQKNKP